MPTLGHWWHWRLVAVIMTTMWQVGIMLTVIFHWPSLQWHHNECDSISNHWYLDCLLHHLFKRRLKKKSKYHITGLCEGNPLVTGISILCSTICSGIDQRKHQSTTSLAFVRGIHSSPVDPPSQKASNMENVAIWWRHHEDYETMVQSIR